MYQFIIKELFLLLSISAVFTYLLLYRLDLGSTLPAPYQTVHQNSMWCWTKAMMTMKAMKNYAHYRRPSISAMHCWMCSYICCWKRLEMERSMFSRFFFSAYTIQICLPFPLLLYSTGRSRYTTPFTPPNAFLWSYIVTLSVYFPVDHSLDSFSMYDPLPLSLP